MFHRSGSTVSGLIPATERGKKRENQCADSGDSACDMPLPPRVSEFRPVCSRGLGAPCQDLTVDRLIRQPRDKTGSNQANDRANEQIAGTPVISGKYGEGCRQNDADASKCRERRVESANRVLLQLDVGCRGEPGGVEAEPDAEHGSHQERHQQKNEEPNDVRGHCASCHFIVAPAVLRIAMPSGSKPSRQNTLTPK